MRPDLRQLLIIAVGGLALAASSLHAQTLRPADVYRLASPSVVVVHGLGGKQDMQGSGVVIRPGVIVSNCHVLQTSARAEVLWEGKSHAATLLHADPERDLCTLAAPSVKAPPARLGDTTSLEVGDPIYAIGAPRGLSFTLSDGLISGMRGEVLQITAPISPGSSGGGLYNSMGELVGVTTLYIQESQQINFALPVEWVLELPARNRLQRRTELQKNTGFSTARPHATAPVSPNPPYDTSFEVLDITIGPAIDANNRIQGARSIFLTNETVHASVRTTGTSPTTLVARWEYGSKESERVPVYESTIVVPPGSHLTAFDIKNANPWPTGNYVLKLFTGDKEVGSSTFCIEDARVVCALVEGNVYSYILNGVRQYSSTPPPLGAEDPRTIRYSFYTVEARKR